ncbi:unnamed protein product [Brassicogethes aeneus]|uniref:Trichohyalin-plectin-homology domain-containing protein n=1 Tax=Brassicogethes aeneus TaxID=1431903 RepID=A0A9P0AXA3_BRAAE|nr:unnamed protein product [Brassicogethes aeneus]
MNIPIVSNCERAYNNRNVKLSWLDQQIEKRMKRERDEEEAKKILKEREETLKKQRELEEDQKKELHEKNRLYKTMLDEQVVELKQKQLEAEMLKQIEREESKKKMSVVEIEEKHTQEERRRLERECALYNIRQHKQKLKQKAVDIQENLAMENELILKLKNLEMERMMQDAIKRQQVKETFEKYANLVKMQQELEKERQKQLDFVFDSEAKDIFERQTELWKNEEKCRQKLLKEVLATVKKQIEDNLEKNRERQRELQREKKENEVNIQEYNKELEKLDREKENKKLNRRVELDEDVKVKNARKFQQENIKLKELDDELDGIRKEEERLKKEILNIQKKHANVRPSTSRTRCFY